MVKFALSLTCSLLGSVQTSAWDCPSGYVGKDQCDSSAEASDCCGVSFPGINCGDREDCFCYKWNCRRLNAGEVLPRPDLEEAAAKNSSADPSRRLWDCPSGYVGKDQCDSFADASACCGDSFPGVNCGDRQDCFCYKWNCRRLNAEKVLPRPDEEEAASKSSSADPSRRLWDCPSGYVGKDQCDSFAEASACCGDSFPGVNCGDRQDCFCYKWKCRRLSVNGTSTKNVPKLTAPNKFLRR